MNAALLRSAAFDLPVEARVAWARWSASHLLDDLDPNASLALPAILANLRRDGFDGELEDQARLDGIARHWRVRQHLQIAGADHVMSILAAVGERAVLSEGAAYSALAYPCGVPRPTEFASLLIRGTSIGPIGQALEAERWLAFDGEPIAAATRNADSAVDVVRGGTRVRLCWDLVPGQRRTCLDASEVHASVLVSGRSVIRPEAALLILLTDRRLQKECPLLWESDLRLLLEVRSLDASLLGSLARDRLAGRVVLRSLVLAEQLCVPGALDLAQVVRHAVGFNWRPGALAVDLSTSPGGQGSRSFAECAASFTSRTRDVPTRHRIALSGRHVASRIRIRADVRPVRGVSSSTKAGPFPSGTARDWRPTASQEELIDLALGHSGGHEGSELAGKWEEWAGRQTRPLTSLDGGSARLLPLVAWQVFGPMRHRHGEETEARAFLRRTLALANVQAIRSTQANERILATLSAAGIEAIVLKGMALRETVYPTPATRPTSDLDFLIPVDRLGDALEWVGQNCAKVSYSTCSPGGTRRFRHAVGATAADGEIDLHWRLLPDSFDERLDDALRTRVVPLMIGGTPTWTLRPEDHVLHAVAHGMLLNELSPIRWVVDVALLVEKNSIDWNLVVNEAIARGLSRRVGVGLRYACDRFHVAVPAHVLDQLHQRSEGRYDKTGMRIPRTLAGRTADLLMVRYLARSRSWSLARRAVNYPSFVRFALQERAARSN